MKEDHTIFVAKRRMLVFRLLSGGPSGDRHFNEVLSRPAQRTTINSAKPKSFGNIDSLNSAGSVNIHVSQAQYAFFHRTITLWNLGGGAKHEEDNELKYQ